MSFDSFKFDALGTFSIAECQRRVDTKRFMNDKIEVGKIQKFAVRKFSYVKTCAEDFFAELFLSFLIFCELLMKIFSFSVIMVAFF